MITFTELLERSKSKKIVVHTPTEEQAVTLLKALDKRGYEWCRGYKLTEETHYEVYKKDTCYVLGYALSFFNVRGGALNKKVLYGPLGYAKDECYNVIEFKDIDFAEKPTKTTLKSDIKTIYQSEDKLTTCVVFIDGTKVKVKKHKGDKGSIYTAVAYAITKKTYGSNKVFTEIVDEKLYKAGK